MQAGIVVDGNALAPRHVSMRSGQWTN